MARPSRCAVCAIEIPEAGQCGACASDETRARFVTVCTALLDGTGDRAALAVEAQDLSTGWSAGTLRQLLGAARRRHVQGALERELASSRSRIRNRARG